MGCDRAVSPGTLGCGRARGVHAAACVAGDVNKTRRVLGTGDHHAGAPFRLDDLEERHVSYLAGGDDLTGAIAVIEHAGSGTVAAAMRENDFICRSSARDANAPYSSSSTRVVTYLKVRYGWSRRQARQSNDVVIGNASTTRTDGWSNGGSTLPLRRVLVSRRHRSQDPSAVNASSS